MVGQKLRNIFVAKYLPILNRMGGVEVEEQIEEEKHRNSRENGGNCTIKDYEFTIRLPMDDYTVLFRDILWDDGETQSWVLCPLWARGKSRKIGENSMGVSIFLFPGMIAHNFRDARSYRGRVTLPNGVVISFKYYRSANESIEPFSALKR
jgi:hypothetical protein